MIAHRLEKTIAPGNRTFPEPRNAGFQYSFLTKIRRFYKNTMFVCFLGVFFSWWWELLGCDLRGRTYASLMDIPGVTRQDMLMLTNSWTPPTWNQSAQATFWIYEGMFSHIAWKLFNQEPLGFFRSSSSILEIFSYIFVCLCSSVFPFERGFGLMYTIAFQSMCLIQNNYLGKDIISTSGDLTKKRRFDIGKSFVECYWFIVPVLVCLSVVFGWFFLILR